VKNQGDGRIQDKCGVSAVGEAAQRRRTAAVQNCGQGTDGRRA